MLWRVCREHVILLHGPAAAVLQVAHPRIGLGVFEHSQFQSSPTDRLDRTLDTVYTMAFGTRAEALAAARRVRGIHARVNGDAAERGVAGEPRYSAFELDLLMWVIATMIMSSVDGYERSIANLTDAEKEQFYRDMRMLGTLFNLPVEHGPPDWKSFLAYWDERISDPQLGAHAISREVAWAVARPRKPWWLWVTSYPLMFMFAEIIPEPVRGRLGFRSTRFTRLSLAGATVVLRVFVKLAPGWMRFVPHYRWATRRSVSPLASALAAVVQSLRRGQASAEKD